MQPVLLSMMSAWIDFTMPCMAEINITLSTVTTHPVLGSVKLAVSAWRQTVKSSRCYYYLGFLQVALQM